MATHTEVAPRKKRRTLWISVAAVAACFVIWTVLAIVGVRIKDVIWTDHYSGRIFYVLIVLAAAIATFALSAASRRLGRFAGTSLRSRIHRHVQRIRQHRRNRAQRR